MSNLYGYLEGDRGGRATKASANHITSIVQTQHGRITVNLTRAGEYEVSESHSGGHYATGYSGTRTIASGNVDEGSGQHRRRSGSMVRGRGGIVLLRNRRSRFRAA